MSWGIESISIAQARSRLVDEVDRLVGQEPIADVALRQGRGGDERGVLDPDSVVQPRTSPSAAQDGDGVLDARLTDEDRLEAALERGVLLDVLAVLRERGGADASQLAARQGRLEHVGGVHGPFRAPRSHERVQLVDEQDVASVALLDFPQQPPSAGPRTPPRYFVPATRAPRSSATTSLFLRPPERHYPRMRRARPSTMAVLPTPGSPIRTGLFWCAATDLDHAANLFVPPDDRVELSTAGQVGEVAGILLDRTGKVSSGSLRRHPLTAPDGTQSLQDLAAGRARFLQEGRPRAVPLDEREKERCSTETKSSWNSAAFASAFFQKRAQTFVDSGGGAAVGLRAGRQEFSYPSLQPRHFDADSLKEDRRQSALLVQERLEKVLRSDVGCPEAAADRWASCSASWERTVNLSRFMLCCNLLQS